MTDKPTLTITTDECVYQQFTEDISTKAILPRDFYKAWWNAQRTRNMMRIHSPKDTKNKEEKQ